jgi:putative ABC transport system permease protein
VRLTRDWGIDLRDAVRSLRARPTFAAAAILLVVVATAAVTSGFAIVYGILWRPLPYPEADRLAVIWQVAAGERTQISYPDYLDVRAVSVFESAAAMSGGRGSLRVGDRIERINAVEIDAPGLAMLGARPYLGRLLSAADAGQPVALISHRLWSTHFNAELTIVGRVIWLSGVEYTVVGVLQPGFDFELPVPPSFRLEQNDVWTVLDASAPFATRREVSTYESIVRLTPGTTLSQAQAVLDTVATRLAAEHPSTNTGRTFQISAFKADLVAPMRTSLILVGLAGIIALLAAVANVLTLSLVRTPARLADLAVREALGAGVFRLRRQVFTEHALIAVVGALGGWVLGREVVRWLVASEAARLPRPDAIRFDFSVLGVTGAVALFIAVVMTLQVQRGHAGLRMSGTRVASSRLRRSRRVLVATEIALAVTLTTAGALLALSLMRLLATDVGFDARGAAAGRVSAYEAEYRTRDDVVRFFAEVVARLESSPDVRVAGAGSSLPLSGQFSGTSVVAEHRPVLPAERPTAGWQFVTPGYFAATGMRLRTGRDFVDADRQRPTHVAIINESLARSLFPGENPVGHRIGVGGGDAQGDWHEVIGVVADVKHQALDVAPAPRVYDLFGQHWGRTLYVVARARTGDPLPLVGRLRRDVASLNTYVPVFESSTLQALVDRSAATRRLAATIAVALAAAGVLLALIGVYAISAASVGERTREIGVRAALGAAPRDLFQMIASEGLRMAAWGGLAGIWTSTAVTRGLSEQLFSVSLPDAALLTIAAAVVVLLAATAAAIPPGRRAAGMDPVQAIRTE